MKRVYIFILLALVLSNTPFLHSQIRNIASIKGTWTGQWVNNFYHSSGFISVNITVDQVNKTAHGDWNVGGNILGQPRLPFSTDITLNDSGFVASFYSSIWGNISGSGLYTGGYSGTAANCPNPNATSIAAVGSFNSRQINGTFTFIWLPAGSSPINGTVTITKQNPINDPTNLTVSVAASGAANLNWNDNASNETGYRIERKNSNTGIWSQIATVGPNSNAYTDNSVMADTPYVYRVAAFNTYTESEYSQEAAYKTLIPVELISFDYALNENGIRLNWVTATEKNNKCFEIDRKLENSGWVKIGIVPGSGTTTEKSYYRFTDGLKNVSLTGAIKYRLKQIDFDGTVGYSQEIEVDAGKILSGYSISQNFPNPFNPVTTIDYQLPVSGFVVLRVYDIRGNEVNTLVKEYKPAGRYSINFDASSLSSGVYLYRLQAGLFNSTKKLVVLK